jgi:hypothetical protein
MIFFQNSIFLKQKSQSRKTTERCCARSTTGFTIIEILVLLGVLSLISTILIINTHSGEKQVNLFKEQARIVSILFRAKSLSISTFGETGISIPCGYGVHFNDSGSFLIFKDLAPDCKSADHKYTDTNEIYESFQLDPAIEFDSLNFSDVVFIPPDPSVVITPSSQDQATIILKIIGSPTTASIKINSAGQIST